MNRTKEKRHRRQKNHAARCEHLRKRLRLKSGARPYYEAFDVHIETRLRGPKVFIAVAYRERATKAYFNVINELMDKCKGMTIDLSAFKKEDVQDAPAPDARG